MATTTTVSRRMVRMKVNKAAKPHVPLPQRSPSSSDETVGEAARPLVMNAVSRKAPPRAWWQKAAKPAGILFALLACGGFLYVMLNAQQRPAYSRSAETAATPAPMSSPTRNRAARMPAYPGSDSAPTNVVLSDRSAPTDDSFRAGAYVRKKVEMPNMSGDCVVKSGLDHVKECLKGREGRQ